MITSIITNAGEGLMAFELLGGELVTFQTQPGTDKRKVDVIAYELAQGLPPIKRVDAGQIRLVDAVRKFEEACTCNHVLGFGDHVETGCKECDCSWNGWLTRATLRKLEDRIPGEPS